MFQQFITISLDPDLDPLGKNPGSTGSGPYNMCSIVDMIIYIKYSMRLQAQNYATMFYLQTDFLQTPSLLVNQLKEMKKG